ncbi:MAG TPA: decarboxylating 6-phosphogluconate dehydrogenase [archaeon]|nr:decarboxylating 6-phosphogluconate dehydrogenase [archaeon]
MKIGFIGLGKMGFRMCEHLLEKKTNLVLYARNADAMKPLSRKGAIATNSYDEFSKKLGKNKIIFLMITHGKPVDDVIASLLPHLVAGDILIDGGNSFYKDSARRNQELSAKGIEFLDVGVSGGLDGARNGASIMVGGKEEIYKKCEWVFKVLATKNGYGHMGKSGAGHFVKMVHNGIEYSLLQAYGEGYALLEKSDYKLDLEEVTKVYQNGSVIRSWLVDLIAHALKKDPHLEKISGVIGGGSTGEWTMQTAKELGIEMPILEKAIFARKKSQQNPDFSTKIAAALRYEFGGHEDLKK